LALVAAVALAEVVIHLKMDGQQTILRVPEGSSVAIAHDGQVDVTLPNDASSKAEATPRAAGATIKNIDASTKPLTLDGVSPDQGGWRIEAKESRTVRLFEVPLVGLENCMLIYRAKIKTEKLAGRAYLEMWCRGPWGEAFSRGLDHPVSGTTAWASYQTPFFLKKDERPDLAKLNIVVEGQGTLWIKDVELIKSPLPTRSAGTLSEFLTAVLPEKPPLIAAPKSRIATESDNLLINPGAEQGINSPDSCSRERRSKA